MLNTFIVHGGAWDIPDDQIEAHVAGCRRAAEAGWALLHNGASAVDAVEAAVRVMEDDPTFDAGHGAFLNAAGEIELDAILMEGQALTSGAVAAVQRVRNPISLARLVMDRTEHCLLVGAGAEAWARTQGVPVCPIVELLETRELERWRAQQADPTFRSKNAFELSASSRRGTVGAVARDSHGNIAAGTSTGGTPNKLPGRVGDSPIIGCGAYADNRTAGVSATGWGESLMKAVFSKTICELVGQGLDAQQAAEAGVRLLAERVNGLGGAIVVDHAGRIGVAYNTPRMAYARALDGDIVAQVDSRVPYGS